MMWSPEPSGTRVGGVHTSPSADFEKSRSLAEQPGRRAQSGHAIIALPSAPTSTLGNGPERPGEAGRRDRALRREGGAAVGRAYDADLVVEERHDQDAVREHDGLRRRCGGALNAASAGIVRRRNRL